MSMSKREATGGRTRPWFPRAYYGPVAWIAVLLGCWFLIAEWQMLPTIIDSTMAALP